MELASGRAPKVRRARRDRQRIGRCSWRKSCLLEDRDRCAGGRNTVADQCMRLGTSGLHTELDRQVLTGGALGSPVEVTALLGAQAVTQHSSKESTMAPSRALDAHEEQGELELAGEFSSVLCELGSAISLIAQNEGRTQRREGDGRRQEDWSQAIGHIDVMLSNEAQQVQCNGSSALAVLAENSSEAKEKICSSAGIIQKLVQVMRGGGLDAIGAMAVITKDHAGACNQAREAGAISVLVDFIASAEQRKGDQTSAAKLSLLTTADVAGTRAETSSSEADGKKSAVQGAVPGMSLSHASMMNVPIASKAQAVSTLRNIATASKENRAAISREDVIPQLVRLMTEKHNVDEKSDKHTTYAQRQKLAEDMRKLAQSAGQLLFTMILEGSKEVKDHIIAAISTRVLPPLASRRLLVFIHHRRFTTPRACVSPPRTTSTHLIRLPSLVPAVAPLSSLEGAGARHTATRGGARAHGTSALSCGRAARAHRNRRRRRGTAQSCRSKL